MKRIIALIILSIGFNLCFGANTEDNDKQQPASSYQPIGVRMELPNFHRSSEPQSSPTTQLAQSTLTSLRISAQPQSQSRTSQQEDRL